MAKSRRGTKAEKVVIRERSGGADFEGDAQIGGDVAGRDVVKSETTIGFGAQAVQRLILTVGLLVFATTACAFTLGFVVASQWVGAFQRPVPVSGALADSLESKLEEARNIQPGERYELELTEAELNSYVNRHSGDFGLQDGEARFVEPGLVAVSGQLESLGGLNVAATFRLQEDSGDIVRLESAVAQIVPLEGSAIGWVALPNFALTSFEDGVNQQLGGGYTTTGVQALGTSSWVVSVAGQ